MRAECHFAPCFKQVLSALTAPCILSECVDTLATVQVGQRTAVVFHLPVQTTCLACYLMSTATHIQSLSEEMKISAEYFSLEMPVLSIGLHKRIHPIRQQAWASITLVYGVTEASCRKGDV